MGRSTECILGRDVETIFGYIFGSRQDALMNAFLGWALKLDLEFLWRFVHALLNAFGGSKFGGLIWKKNKVSVGRPTECMLGADFRARFGMIFGSRQLALLRADFQARVESIFGSR